MKSSLHLITFARGWAFACYFAILLGLISSTQTVAQQSKLPQNPTESTPWVNGTTLGFTVTQTNTSPGVSTWNLPLSTTNTAPRAIDNNLNQPAEGTVVVSGSVSLKVADANTYDAGNFVGFLVRNTSVVGANLLGSVTIKTYLDDAPQETSTSASLLGLSTSLVSGATELGIYATKPYNQVEIIFSNPLGLVTTYDVYYAVQRAYKAGPALASNIPAVVSYPTFPVIISPANTGTTLVGTVANADAAIDASTSNAASLSVTAIGSASLSVKNQVTNYPAKTFAGFDIENTTVLNLGIFNNITLRTFLDGVPKETINANNGLVSLGLLNSSGRQRVGFITNEEFDEIQITVASTLNVNLGTTSVYNAVLQAFADGPELTCNTPTALTSPSYPVIISSANTGISSIACVNCQITTPDNLIDGNPATHADIVLAAGVAVSGSIAVKSVEQSYPAGTFAGFDINSPTIIGVGVASGLRIETYLNGLATGDVSGNGSLANVGVPLLSGSGRQVIGFLTTREFDEIKLTVDQTVGLTAGTTTEVYGAVFTRFCTGTSLACNTPTSVTNPAFPVFIDGKNTGISTAACVACTINNSGFAIDNNPSTAATLVLAAGVVSTGSFAVANALDTYAATSFAGFDVETATLLSADALSAATISLYNNGTLVQTGTGNALIVGASSALLTGTTRQIVGIVATTDYDEVKITFNQIAGANLGNIQIYGAIFDKLCAGTIACNNSYLLTQPSFPVVINSANTGITGAVCAGCLIADPWNVVSASTSDFARVTLVANAAATASLAVVNPIDTYPAGTGTGFIVRPLGSIAQVDLLNSITISTYNNGTFQESQTGAGLLNVELLGALVVTVNPAANVNVGFLTTKPFDEVRIELRGVANVINENDIFGAFVDTRTSVGGGALSCNVVRNPDFNVTSVNVQVPGNVSTNDKVPTGTTYGPAATADGSNPSGATFSLNPDGTYTFSAPTVGVYTYQIPVCVPDLPCISAPLTITVTNPTLSTNPPIANKDIAAVTGGATTPGSVTINVKANDTPGNTGGVLGDPVPSAPAHGTATVSNGNIVYTPVAGYFGEDIFTYQVCETPGNLCATTTVNITVKQPGATNTTYAADDYASTNISTSVSGNVSANDTDPEGNTQTVTAQTVNASAGTFTLQTDGSFTFAPASGFSGPVEFIYTTCDNGATSACANATLHLLVKSTTPLPVTLTSFMVIKEGQSALLQWTTTMEANSDRFEIERSQNGKNWDLIGVQRSNGESTSLKNYSFSDAKPQLGENLYRLKMIDRDATYAYSRIQALTFESGFTTSFYPNPVTEKLIIKTDDFDLVKSIKIYDATGKTVYQSAVRPTREINVQSLPSGLYIIQMVNKSGSTISHKVLKQ